MRLVLIILALTLTSNLFAQKKPLKEHYRFIYAVTFVDKKPVRVDYNTYGFSFLSIAQFATSELHDLGKYVFSKTIKDEDGLLTTFSDIYETEKGFSISITYSPIYDNYEIELSYKNTMVLLTNIETTYKMYRGDLPKIEDYLFKD